MKYWFALLFKDRIYFKTHFLHLNTRVVLLILAQAFPPLWEASGQSVVLPWGRAVWVPAPTPPEGTLRRGFGISASACIFKWWKAEGEECSSIRIFFPGDTDTRSQAFNFFLLFFGWVFWGFLGVFLTNLRPHPSKLSSPAYGQHGFICRTRATRSPSAGSHPLVTALPCSHVPATPLSCFQSLGPVPRVMVASWFSNNRLCC